MKACSYCGRDNNDDSVDCRECGTEFPNSKTVEPLEAASETNETLPTPFTDLSALNFEFETVESFSRPNWKSVYEFVKKHVPRDDKAAVYDCIVNIWLEELARDLGGNARVRRTRHFYCLTDLDTKTTNSLLAYAESVLDIVRGNLGIVAWTGFYGRHVLLLFSDPDDYYPYISYFYPDGTYIQSTGIFIHHGYTHIALPYINMASAQHTLVHELTHNLLCHLRIPVWLNEGLAQMIERIVKRRGFLMDRELANRHHHHWNETNIQAFWAGRTFKIPGDDSELSYNLSEVLVGLLAEKGPKFTEFIRTADWRDAGQDAAVSSLGQGLEEVVIGFLGPGDWRPQRQAIKANLKPAENH